MLVARCERGTVLSGDASIPRERSHGELPWPHSDNVFYFAISQM